MGVHRRKRAGELEGRTDLHHLQAHTYGVDAHCRTLLASLSEPFCWGTLEGLHIHGCKPDMEFLRVIRNKVRQAVSGQKTLGSTRSFQASRPARISILILTSTYETSVLLRLMTQRCWTRGCTAGWKLILPVHSLDRASVSGDHCVT